MIKRLKRWQWSADLAVWTVLCIITGAVAIVYLSLGLVASDGSLVMPLDDTYIHFQYARQMANGEPFVYNPGDEATSGATSFLYGPLLALGYVWGLKGLQLSYWAISLGVLSFLGSGWLVYRLTLSGLSKTEDFKNLGIFAPLRVVSFGISTLFLLNGAFTWAALSGMETSLVIFTTLLTLWAFHQDKKYLAITGAIFTTLLRPEGAIIAAGLSITLLWNNFKQKKFKHWQWYLLPILAITVQPTTNLLLTGSPSASGNAAKSLLYNSTIPLTERFQATGDNFTTLWQELIIGHNPVDGAYLPSSICLLALLTISISLGQSWKTKKINSGTLAGVWILGLSLAIATLDTAFWHFKRYQLPIMALMLPLAGWALIWLTQNLSRKSWQAIPAGLTIGLVLTSTITTLDYTRRYHDNIYVVKNQQIAMANWIDNHLPKDTRIGVHDVGVVRYIGDRATYDMVGLTTEGVATAWRQGPGTIYDTMAGHEHRPEYFAVYHDIQGLPFLAEAGVFGKELERFTIPLPENTVASATSTQIVSKADWTTIEDSRLPRQNSTLAAIGDFTLLHEIDVANLNEDDTTSEEHYNYEWLNDKTPEGFATAVRRLPYAACESEPCTITDGGRIINGQERFVFDTHDGQEYLVVLRVHAAGRATLRAGCENDEQTIHVVPEIPGHFVELPFQVDDGEFCVEAIEGSYESHYYWIYAGHFSNQTTPETIIADFNSPDHTDSFYLTEMDISQTESTIQLDLTWLPAGDLRNDAKIFIHLYQNPDQPPIAQFPDTWPGGGAYPPGNWLPGTLQDSYTLDTSALAPGTYQLGIGFYDPATNTRYTVVKGGTTSDRLFLDEISID